MKVNVFFAAVPLFFALTAASAQGYVGAVSALSRVEFDCPTGSSCDHSGQAWKFYAGSKLSSGSILDIGVGQGQYIEVAYTKYNPIKSSIGPTTIGYLDSGGQAVTREAATALKVQADAITVAAVYRFALMDQLGVNAKLGAAYVSSTVKKDIEGVQYTSETSTKIKPYFGLGLEYEILPTFKLVGSFDLTQYDVPGRKGNLMLFGLGAEKAF